MLVSQGNDVTFHRVALRPIDGCAAPVRPGEIRRLRGHGGALTCAGIGLQAPKLEGFINPVEGYRVLRRAERRGKKLPGSLPF